MAPGFRFSRKCANQKLLLRFVDAVFSLEPRMLLRAFSPRTAFADHRVLRCRSLHALYASCWPSASPHTTVKVRFQGFKLVSNPRTSSKHLTHACQRQPLVDIAGHIVIKQSRPELKRCRGFGKRACSGVSGLGSGFPVVLVFSPAPKANNPRAVEAVRRNSEPATWALRAARQLPQNGRRE